MVEVHPSDDPGFALTEDQELLVAGDQRTLAPILPGHREPGLAEARVVGRELGGHTPQCCPSSCPQGLALTQRTCWEAQ